MKKVSTICMILVTVLFFGCEGPEGPLGPQGLKGDQGETGSVGPKGDVGTTGANGTAGTNGKDGNANVVYSAWLVPTWSPSGSNVYYSSFEQENKQNNLLTQDAIDKGVVYTYVKARQLNYNSDKQEYELLDVISPNDGDYFMKIPGRTSNDYRDFTRAYFYISNEIGVNYLNVGATLVKIGANENYTNYETPIPELENKSIDFYKDLLKDLKYRIVVVHGSTQGRINVDMSNYEAVKEAYNLPD